MALRPYPRVAFAVEPDSVRITLNDGAGFLLCLERARQCLESWVR